MSASKKEALAKSASSPQMGKVKPEKIASILLLCYKGKLKGWSKRWLVISADHSILLYRDKSEKKVEATVKMVTCSIRDIEVDKKTHQRPFFQIVYGQATKERPSVLLLTSVDDASQEAFRDFWKLLTNHQKKAFNSSNRKTLGSKYTKDLKKACARNDIVSTFFGVPENVPCGSCLCAGPSWKSVGPSGEQIYLCIGCSADRMEAPNSMQKASGSRTAKVTKEPSPSSSSSSSSASSSSGPSASNPPEMDRSQWVAPKTRPPSNVRKFQRKEAARQALEERRNKILGQPRRRELPTLKEIERAVSPVPASTLSSNPSAGFQAYSLNDSDDEVSFHFDDSDDDLLSDDEDDLDFNDDDKFAAYSSSPVPSPKAPKPPSSFTPTPSGSASPSPPSSGSSSPSSGSRRGKASAPAPPPRGPKTPAAPSPSSPLAPAPKEKAIVAKSFDDSDSDDDFMCGEDDLSSGDWNHRFQTIIRELTTFTPNTPIADQISANLALIGLAQDFLYSATTYGKIIISEVYLDDREKTIKPVELGGVAGGSKYMVHQILFKFALDTQGIYGNDDASSAKVGGHELKGLQAYFNCKIPGLHLPLMALVDYRGFRLIAISMLPISDNTIVYGSRDGGNTVHNEDAPLNDMMKRAAEILNVKEHSAGLKPAQRKILHSAADVEGHIGHDGRRYLLDFSRTFPCEKPNRSVKGSHLFNLLRPELVKKNPVPLCSDAYSNFTDSSHNAQIDEATDHLLSVVISTFALELPGHLANHQGDISSFRLTEALHSKGINCRYIGEVWKAVGTIPVHIPERERVRELLAEEMVARVLKNDIRHRLRQRMKKLRVPLEDPYRQLLVDYLNIVFGQGGSPTDDFWSSFLPRRLHDKFPGVFLSPPSSSSSSSPSSPKGQGSEEEDEMARAVGAMRRGGARERLLRKVQKMMGFRFTAQGEQDLAGGGAVRFERAKPFQRTDVDTMGERIKHMNIVGNAEGFLMMVKGFQSRVRDSHEAVAFFGRAIDKFDEVLTSNPNSKVSLVQCSRALVALDEELRRQTHSDFVFDSPRISRANDYLLRAVDLDPLDPLSLYHYAQFLEMCGKLDLAEEFYLRVLEVDPNYVEALHSYGSLLDERNDHEYAERFFLRIAQQH